MPGRPKPFLPPPAITSQELAYAKALTAPPALAQILWQKGVRDVESAREFMAPKLESNTNVPPLKNLSELVQELNALRSSQKKLLIHGDYDVDGIAGAAVLFLGLRECGINLAPPFLPHRFKDGYGLTLANVQKFADQKIEHIITVDTGISAFQEVELANTLGIKVYITDHHQPPPQLPQATLIVNPNQPGCPHPFKNLSGTGVAYRVVEAFREYIGLPQKPELLQFVALASLADMAYLDTQNRGLVKAGLKQLRQTKIPGLMALLQEVGLFGCTLTASEILFRLTPLINAAGRLKSPQVALDLFCANTAHEARKGVLELKKLNAQRKALDRKTYEEALVMEESGAIDIHKPVLVFFDPHWHEGVIGILAAKLVDRYHKPVLVCTRVGDHLRGSGRTTEGISIHAHMAQVSMWLEKWGGHDAAVGFNLKPENLTSFTKALEECFLNSSSLSASSPEILLEEPTLTSGLSPSNYHKGTLLESQATLSLPEIDASLIPWLIRLEPMGPGNEVPIFFTPQVKLEGEVQRMGEHIKFFVTDGKVQRFCLAFGHADWSATLANSSSFDIIYHIDKNFFRGTESLQLRILSFKPHSLTAPEHLSPSSDLSSPSTSHSAFTSNHPSSFSSLPLSPLN